MCLPFHWRLNTILFYCSLFLLPLCHSLCLSLSVFLFHFTLSETFIARTSRILFHFSFSLWLKLSTSISRRLRRRLHSHNPMFVRHALLMKWWNWMFWFHCCCCCCWWCGLFVPSLSSYVDETRKWIHQLRHTHFCNRRICRVQMTGQKIGQNCRIPCGNALRWKSIWLFFCFSSGPLSP